MGRTQKSKDEASFAFIAVNNNKLLRDSCSFAITLIGLQVSSRLQFDRRVRNAVQVSYSAIGPVLVWKECRDGNFKDTSPPNLNSELDRMTNDFIRRLRFKIFFLFFFNSSWLYVRCIAQTYNVLNSVSATVMYNCIKKNLLSTLYLTQCEPTPPPPALWKKIDIVPKALHTASTPQRVPRGLHLIYWVKLYES